MNELPMFERASRRAVLKRALAASGLLAVGAALASCGDDDAAVFSSTATSAAPGTTGAPATTTPPTAARRSSVPTTVPSAARPATVAIAFTYTAADAGRVRNPYVAAWVEDGSSTMVGLISVWYSTRDARYLRELTEFTAAAGDASAAQVDAVSGATRTPGAATLQWDGVGLDGSPLVGDHTVWIEAAREHGPHSVISGPVTFGRSGTTTIAGSGELSDATVTIG
jgi:hypothetical protein